MAAASPSSHPPPSFACARLPRPLECGPPRKGQAKTWSFSDTSGHIWPSSPPPGVPSVENERGAQGDDVRGLLFDSKSQKVSRPASCIQHPGALAERGSPGQGGRGMRAGSSKCTFHTPHRTLTGHAPTPRGLPASPGPGVPALTLLSDCAAQGSGSLLMLENKFTMFCRACESIFGGFNLLNKSFSDCTLLNPWKIHEHAGNRDLIGKV